MLQQMRQFSKSWISSLFLGALTLSFVAWGVGDIFRGTTSTAVATVGKTSLDQTEFQRDYTNFLRNEGARRGKDITPDEARRENMGDLLLQRDIVRMALDNLAGKYGLTVSDDYVASQIRSIQSFAGVTGTFDKAVFLQAIERYGYTEKGFIEIMRRDSARDQLLQGAEAGFMMPLSYARAIFAYTTEMRAADYVTVDTGSLGPIATPSDAILQAYMAKHADGFSTPEYRDVTFAEIGPDDVGSSIAVSDAQIQTAYDQHKDQYVIPEKRELEQIVFPTQAEAQAARAKIDTGTTFAQIAEARDVKPADLTLGERVAADLDPDRAKAAFALPEGGVTQPVKFTFGYALLHVVKITPGKTTTLDQAKPEIKTALQKELAQAKLDEIANAYTDASSGGASLTVAAQKAGMHTGHITAMDKDGLAPDGSKTAAPDDPGFRAAVFKAESGEEGDPFETPAGHYYVVSVNGTMPPKLKPLDQVRAQVLAAWTAEQRITLLKQKAQELAKQANKDGSLANVAKEIRANVQSSPALTHSTSDNTFSPELITALFKAKPGAVVYGPAGKGGGYVIAHVSGIVHPLPPQNDPSFIGGVRMLSRDVASDVVESFAKAARDKQGVKTNAKLLDNVIGGEGS